MLIEKLGFWLLVIKVIDFNWLDKLIFKEYKEVIKVKYKIDRLMIKKFGFRIFFFVKIEVAEKNLV